MHKKIVNEFNDIIMIEINLINNYYQTSEVYGLKNGKIWP